MGFNLEIKNLLFQKWVIILHQIIQLHIQFLQMQINTGIKLSFLKSVHKLASYWQMYLSLIKNDYIILIYI